MLQIENVSFSYRRRKPGVLCDFSLSLEKGKVYGLLGRNGAGKSTLLYLMSGLLTPGGGKVLYHGIDVRRRLPATLQDVFLVPEEFDLPAIPLSRYVDLNAPFYPRFSREDMYRYLHCFEMDAEQHLGGLSMGQKKKVFMSFALAANTSLLLMDEPTNGLDIPSKSQFRKVLASGMSEEKSVVISTHQVRDIDRLLDHVIVIDGSQVLLDESVVRITDKLFFAEQGMSDPTDDALYVQPSVHGNSVILPNRYGEESPLNLELLFNALLTESEKIQKIFTE